MCLGRSLSILGDIEILYSYHDIQRPYVLGLIITLYALN